jgi:hypothetical protein
MVHEEGRAESQEPLGGKTAGESILTKKAKDAWKWKNLKCPTLDVIPTWLAVLGGIVRLEAHSHSLL